MGTAPESARGRATTDENSGAPAAAPRPHRIVLVDDHHLVRLAIRTLLEAEPDLEVVGEADTLASARALVATADPDVVLLDVHLPDGDGLALCADTAEHDVKVLILTAYAGEELLVEAMQAGASGYMVKQDRPEEVVVALRTVATGGAHFSGTATPQMLAVIATGGLPEDPLAHLTDREKSLLSLLGEGLSNRQIAERLFLGERTVKNYVSRLLRKLDLDRRAEAAVFAARLEAQREMRRYAPAVGS